MRGEIRAARATAPVVLALSVSVWLVVSAAPALAVTPTITSFSPSFGPVGTVVTITGTNFRAPDVTQVKIGKKSEAFTIDTDTHIKATVASGTQSGAIQVTNADGTATSETDFTVGSAPVPQIASFTPASGPVGTTVTITGSGFTGATAVARPR
jgi:hypothetical protein